MHAKWCTNEKKNEYTCVYAYVCVICHTNSVPKRSMNDIIHVTTALLLLFVIFVYHVDASQKNFHTVCAYSIKYVTFLPSWKGLSRALRIIEWAKCRILARGKWEPCCYSQDCKCYEPDVSEYIFRKKKKKKLTINAKLTIIRQREGKI